MKIFKKILIFLLVVAVIGVIIVVVFNNKKTMFDQSVSDEKRFDVTEDLVETKSGIVYSGKVVPKEIRYYSKDPSKKVNNLYVKENSVVNKGTLLFDYQMDSTIDAQIKLLNDKFSQFKTENDTNYTLLDQFQTDRKNADPSDSKYIEWLDQQINLYRTNIDTTNLNRLDTEKKIKSLRDSKQDFYVYSDIDGFVYKINEDNTSVSTMQSAYVIVYSNKKIVRINVSEYELNLFNEGKEVSVYIEGLDKTYKSYISKVDRVPNNLESNDTSYFYVEIEIDDDIGYGYSADITVSK